MEHLNTAGVAGGAAGEEKEFNLYRDIKFRTDGEIYLGVGGPVRTETFFTHHAGVGCRIYVNDTDVTPAASRALIIS